MKQYFKEIFSNSITVFRDDNNNKKRTSVSSTTAELYLFFLGNL